MIRKSVVIDKDGPKNSKTRDPNYLRADIPFNAAQRTSFNTFVELKGLIIGKYIRSLILKDMDEQTAREINPS